MLSSLKFRFVAFLQHAQKWLTIAFKPRGILPYTNALPTIRAAHQRDFSATDKNVRVCKSLIYKDFLFSPK
jgi:hypothetical protein